jgi:hypothetical protein
MNATRQMCTPNESHDNGVNNVETGKMKGEKEDNLQCSKSIKYNEPKKNNDLRDRLERLRKKTFKTHRNSPNPHPITS